MKSFKSYGRLVKWLFGANYDFFRFFKYGGWKYDLSSKDQRGYYAIKIYHSLEKSLSFTNNKPNSGWANAMLLVEVIEAAIKYNNHTKTDITAYSVLEKFIEKNYPNASVSLSEEVKQRFEKLKIDVNIIEGEKNGVLTLTSEYLRKGVMLKPEDFFYSRYSVREFSDIRINQGTIAEAVMLALKTPSACNRQPWHVYHLKDDVKIKKALALQTGNRGFDHTIQDLLVICADIAAFNPGSERYQHWIDGGMFAMSLVYSLHSLGVASCCLNWSHQGNVDKALRKTLPEIRHSHTVIMMLAVGNARESNTLCVSPRSSVQDVLTEVEK